MVNPQLPAKKKIAVILAGAVAKGAFEAGALDTLVRRLPKDVEIVRVVGASSGALNAAMLASGIHRGKLLETTEALTELWEKEGGIWNAFHLSLADTFKQRGMSDQKRLRRLLEQHIEPAASIHAVDLKIILAPLSGNPCPGSVSSGGTTFEAMLSFNERDFESSDGLDKVFDAAVASSAFPVLFAPFAPTPSLGPCIDGGVVNNTPIKYAISDGSIDTVVVISPTVAEVMPGEFDDVQGLDLLGHVSDMLINERMHRDLEAADNINDALHALDALVASDQLSSAQLHQVKRAIGWSGYKQLDLITIRPARPLAGNSFSAFLKPALRLEYVADGRQCAADRLSAIGW